MNFSLVNSELSLYHGRRRTPLVDQQFSHVRLAAPLLDAASITTELRGAISARFCFTYSLGSVTVMPRRLHARLCHAFLVVLLSFFVFAVVSLVLRNRKMKEMRVDKMITSPADG